MGQKSNLVHRDWIRPMELEIDQLRKENAGLTKEIEGLWKDNAHLKICQDNAAKREDVLKKQVDLLADVIDDGVSCDNCKASPSKCFKNPSKPCNQAIVEWAKQKAKEAE